ncbi:MAG TPA: DNA-processing protein DprA [Chthonomonadaceae bacterium]|nr:DNA-processing protein DprA [Chthonomonadaceae bacterium]
MTSRTPSETPDYVPVPPAGDALRAWLRLANMQFTACLTTALLTRFAGDPQAIFAAADAELDAVPGFQARHLVRLRDPALEASSRQLAWVERHGVALVLHGQPEYPRLLRHIPDPPPILFVRGSLTEADRFSMGIVGSRYATPYGRATALRLARELAEQGVVVVSGGAVGIDTAAHQGALAGGGRTLAVLGCGLDVNYPRENQALFEQITAQGALITEYPLGAQPEAWRFPLRNRILSGLSLGVLVVEAPRQSGALITAARAAEQGRPVMVIPGNIDRPSSEGSNELLKEGAAPVTCAEDVLRGLNLMTAPARPQHQRALDLVLESAMAEPSGGESASAPFASQQEWGIPGEEGAATRSQAARDLLARQMPESQRKLLECLSLTPRYIDAIAQEAGMTTVQAGVEITLLELSGQVRRLPGNTYIRAL